jgi:hypothetical protein
MVQNFDEFGRPHNHTVGILKEYRFTSIIEPAEDIGKTIILTQKRIAAQESPVNVPIQPPFLADFYRNFPDFIHHGSDGVNICFNVFYRTIDKFVFFVHFAKRAFIPGTVFRDP